MGKVCCGRHASGRQVQKKERPGRRGEEALTAYHARVLRGKGFSPANLDFPLAPRRPYKTGFLFSEQIVRIPPRHPGPDGGQGGTPEAEHSGANTLPDIQIERQRTERPAGIAELLASYRQAYQRRTPNEVRLTRFPLRRDRGARFLTPITWTKTARRPLSWQGICSKTLQGVARRDHSKTRQCLAVWYTLAGS